MGTWLHSVIYAKVRKSYIMSLMTKTEKSSSGLNFSDKFLWGASVSTHQVEGCNHNQWSIWELETARQRAAESEYNYSHLDCWEDIKDQVILPSNYVSGVSSDHYNRYVSDFEYVKTLNFTALRSGIEWSRIEPEDGKFDKQALAHYQDYFKELKKAGVTPILTLWHWTFPEWFADKGGFLKRSNVKYFVRYVKFIMENFGVDIKYFITINEPTTYAGMSYYEKRWPPQKKSVVATVRVLHNLALAHRRAYKIIKKRYPKSQVGLAHSLSYFYAGDSSIISRFSAWVAHKVGNEYFLNLVKKQQDYFGLNYYFANRLVGTRVHNLNKEQNDLGWSLEPDKLRPFLSVLYKKYKLPIIITESGVADRQDKYRKWWIAQSIKAIDGAQKDGVMMLGYIHWSLLDNFEWAEGFWPRFGLIEVDYKTQQRSLRPSAKWYGQVIGKIRGL